MPINSVEIVMIEHISPCLVAILYVLVLIWACSGRRRGWGYYQRRGRLRQKRIQRNREKYLKTDKNTKYFHKN